MPVREYKESLDRRNQSEANVSEIVDRMSSCMRAINMWGIATLDGDSLIIEAARILEKDDIFANLKTMPTGQELLLAIRQLQQDRQDCLDAYASLSADEKSLIPSP